MKQIRRASQSYCTKQNLCLFASSQLSELNIFYTGSNHKPSVADKTRLNGGGKAVGIADVILPRCLV